jgi:hypothetical protein
VGHPVPFNDSLTLAKSALEVLDMILVPQFFIINFFHIYSTSCGISRRWTHVEDLGSSMMFLTYHQLRSYREKVILGTMEHWGPVIIQSQTLTGSMCQGRGGYLLASQTGDLG